MACCETALKTNGLAQSSEMAAFPVKMPQKQISYQHQVAKLKVLFISFLFINFEVQWYINSAALVFQGDASKIFLNTRCEMPVYITCSYFQPVTF